MCSFHVPFTTGVRGINGGQCYKGQGKGKEDLLSDQGS
jgi:hypothetical protein